MKFSKKFVRNSILHFKRWNTAIATSVKLHERSESRIKTRWIRCVLFRVMRIIFHSKSFENLIWCNCPMHKCSIRLIQGDRLHRRNQVIEKFSPVIEKFSQVIKKIVFNEKQLMQWVFKVLKYFLFNILKWNFSWYTEITK